MTAAVAAIPRAGARPGGAVVAGFDLTMRFGTVEALRGVDLAIGPGESVAIMGPSGSGKSTLLHCLAAITAPTSGEVHVDGARIDQLGERRRVQLRRQRFGFVFQAHHLVPELPADENVALPLLLGGTPRRAAVAQARSWFVPLGLDGRQRHRPGELSGGEAQRVAIARALVTQPSVVFADEPTAALDQATGDQVLDLLVGATRDAGSAIVVVTHNPDVAARCGRVVHLRDGSVVDEPHGAAGGPTARRAVEPGHPAAGRSPDGAAGDGSVRSEGATGAAPGSGPGSDDRTGSSR